MRVWLALAVLASTACVLIERERRRRVRQSSSYREALDALPAAFAWRAMRDGLGGICSNAERRARQLREAYLGGRRGASIADGSGAPALPRRPPSPKAARSRSITLPPAPVTGQTAFRLVRVPMDGSCFYHACAHGLRVLDAEEARTHRDVRAATAAVLERRCRAPEASRRLREAARRCREEDGWAHEEEVGAAAAALRRHLLVYEGANRCWVSFGEDADPPVYMLNRAMVHFDALVPVSERTTSAP